MKRGAKLSDKDLCGLAGWSHYPQLHGQFNSNYIASYILLTKMAVAYNNGDYKDPANINGLSAYDYNVLCNIVGGGINGVAWSDVLGNYTKNNRNKALIVYGMALHTATDTFAHSSFRNGVYLDHHIDLDGDGKADADDEEYFVNSDDRYIAAEAIARNALVHCAKGTQGNVSDFAVGNVGYSFRIKYYSKYASTINKNKYINNQLAFDSINLD